MTSGGSQITAGDVESLNNATILRSAAIAKLAGTALVVISSAGMLAWLWLVARSQLELGPYGIPFRGEGDPAVDERIDQVASTLGLLVNSALALTIGCAVRMLSDYVTARSGGSLTGYEPGDLAPIADE